MKYIFLKIKEFWKKFIFYVRCHIYNRLFEKSLKNKECLQVARKSDFKGNYDIDGVSFDGNHIYVNGKLV